MKPIGDTGLRFGFVGRRAPIIALALGLAFGTWMAVLDATVFGAAAPETPAWARIFGVIPRVVLDEIALRLLAMTALVGLFVGIARERRAWCYGLAIALVAAVAYPLWDYAYFRALEWSPLTAAREIAVHVSASALWGWLYWRHGFLAAVTGHCAAHLALQPLLSLLA